MNLSKFFTTILYFFAGFFFLHFSFSNLFSLDVIDAFIADMQYVCGDIFFDQIYQGFHNFFTDPCAVSGKVQTIEEGAAF